MVHPTLAVRGDSAPVSSTPSPSTQASSATSTDAFAQQLASAIQSYLSSTGNGSGLEIDIQPGAGQNSAGGSQFLVTVKDASARPSSTPAPSGPSSPTSSPQYYTDAQATLLATAPAGSVAASTILPNPRAVAAAPLDSDTPQNPYALPPAPPPVSFLSTAVSGGGDATVPSIDTLLSQYAQGAMSPFTVEAVRNGGQTVQDAVDQLQSAASGYVAMYPYAASGSEVDNSLATYIAQVQDYYAALPA